MNITVVLSGAPNDKEALQTAVRMAACESGQVRVVVARDCTREQIERHLDFVLWDVRERLKLPPPSITVESKLDSFSLGVRQMEALPRLTPPTEKVERAV